MSTASVIALRMLLLSQQRPFRALQKLVLSTLLVASLVATAAAGGERIEIELAVAKQTPVDLQKRWHDFFQSLPAVAVKLRQQRSGDEPRRDAAEGGARIVALVNERGELLVPGARFGPKDRAKVQDWLSGLNAPSPDSDAGQSPRRRLPLATLAEPVAFSTQGEPLAEVVARLQEQLRTPVEIDFDARDRLRAAEQVQPPTTVADELQGVACGTALAAVLRSQGLVLVFDSGEPRPTIKASTDARDAWPVGELVTEGAKQLVPGLFESFHAELAAVPAERVIGGLAKRLEVPVLFDRATLALDKLDLAQARVTFPPRKTAYMTLLREACKQASLRYELRTDDAGKPFLWFTSKKAH